MFARARSTLLVTTIALAGCSDGSAPDLGRFLGGTMVDRGIALMVNQSNALFMLQTGAPATRQEIPLGASSAVTAVGFAVRGTKAIVPLGNAASVALVDLTNARTERFFTFPSGNSTGGEWLDDQTAIVCNQNSGEDYCGRVSIGQAGQEVTDTVQVAAFPTSIVTAGSRVFVISSNLDDSYTPREHGVVTEIDRVTMETVRTFSVGRNPQYGAMAPNGKLYVVNSGNYGSANGSLSVIDLGTNDVETITGFGEFPGAISIDDQGRAFISSFAIGTLVWDTEAGTFLRSPSNPLCAPISAGGCRGASGAEIAPNGDLYQAFYGSAGQGLAAYLFIYNGSTLALRDSIAVPMGPNGMTVRSF